MNHYWRYYNSRVLVSRQGRQYRESVKSHCLKIKTPLPGPIKAQLIVFPPDHRRRDLDNLNKAILDALQAGGYLIKTTGPIYPPENAEAEEIEALVSEIARQTPKLAQALRAQYFDRGTLPFKARKIGVSRTQFKVYVDMGKQWLAGRLSIKL